MKKSVGKTNKRVFQVQATIQLWVGNNWNREKRFKNLIIKDKLIFFPQYSNGIVIHRHQKMNKNFLLCRFIFRGVEAYSKPKISKKFWPQNSFFWLFLNSIPTPRKPPPRPHLTTLIMPNKNRGVKNSIILFWINHDTEQ